MRGILLEAGRFSDASVSAAAQDKPSSAHADAKQKRKAAGFRNRIDELKGGMSLGNAIVSNPNIFVAQHGSIFQKTGDGVDAVSVPEIGVNQGRDQAAAINVDRSAFRRAQISIKQTAVEIEDAFVERIGLSGDPAACDIDNAAAQRIAQIIGVAIGDQCSYRAAADVNLLALSFQIVYAAAAYVDHAAVSRKKTADASGRDIDYAVVVRSKEANAPSRDHRPCCD